MNRFSLGFILSCALTFGADISKGNFGGGKDADQSSKSANAAPASRPARNSYPFHGTLESVNTTNKILTLQGKKKNRVIALTPETRFLKNDTKARPEDALPGQRITGTVRKNDLGQEEAITVRISDASAPRK